MSKIVPVKQDYLALLNEKLTPYRTQYLVDGTILMEFWKVQQDKDSIVKNTPKTRNAKKEMALISIDKSRETFMVKYHPLDKNTQIVQNLTINKLLEVVQNLKDAGF